MLQISQKLVASIHANENETKIIFAMVLETNWLVGHGKDHILYTKKASNE